MSTPIQPVPDVILAPPFPTLADRPAGLYNQMAAAWANGENLMVTRTWEIALTAHNNAISAAEQAVTAKASADAAALSEQAAAASAAAAASVAGASKWISGETYAEGQAVWSPVNYQTYRRAIAGSGAVDPSIDTVNWAPLGTPLSQLHAVALSF